VKGECETKGLLIRTAVQLLWENSYGSVSVDDICKRAQVKKGSFYHFFPSKSDLAVVAMETSWQEKRPFLDQVFSAQIPPLERISRFCDASQKNQQEKKDQCGKICGCPLIALGCELSTQDEKIRLKAVEIMDRYVTYLESAVRDAAAAGLLSASDFHQLAKDLFSYSQGLLLQAKVRNDLSPLASMKSGMLRLLNLKEIPTPA
jgi:TetR/AcrR family transcriptional repressor of nem operon